MEVLSAERIERIYRVADGLKLHRDWVVVPMDAALHPLERLMVDGKVLIHAPGGPAFEPWLEGLRERLEALDLRAVPRSHERDPKWVLTGPGSPRFEGTMRYLRGGVPAWKR